MTTGGSHVSRRPRLSPRLQLLYALLVLLSTVPVVVRPAAAQDWSAPRTVYVPETGHTTDGYFLDIWRTQRALLGDPVTQELTPRSGFQSDASGQQIIQYFQNLALVYLPSAPAGEQVDTLHLGAEALADAIAQRPSAALSRAARRTACPPGAAGSCLGFAASGHTLRGKFLEYWNSDDAARWLGPPVSEALRVADGSVIQYLERGVLQQRRTGVVEPLPLGLATARSNDVSTEPLEQPEDVPIFDDELFVPPPAPDEPGEDEDSVAPGWGVGGAGPGPQQGAWKEVVISISQQALWAYEESEMVMSTYVSTGTADVPETVTPIGSWSILSKYDVQDMEGTISDEYYFVEAVPNVMYFDNLGNALHGAYWHSNFGAPMSHGCINLPLDVAAWMYSWAPVGTAVTVIP